MKLQRTYLMQLTKFYWILIPLVTLLTSCNPDHQDDDILPALIMENVSYGNHPDQIFDLHLPEGRTSARTKVIVLVHGGGWINGDKSNMDEYVDYFKANHPEHAILNLNYVLAELGTTPAFPNQYLDIQAAINHVTLFSEIFHILPEYGMLGSSAGAQLAMMYDYVYDTADHVKFVANIVGPSDFTDPFFVNNPNYDTLKEQLVDESQYPPDADVAVLNSPSHQVTISASPTLMFYGDKDNIVPISNAYTLDNALLENDQNNLLTVYSGNHASNWNQEDRNDMNTKIDNYMLTYLSID